MKKTNWAGNVTFRPTRVVYPETESDVQRLVLQAANDRQKIRVIGSGHSFSALCKTEHILLSLDTYQGLVAVDKDRLQATVKAGTKLKALGELLFREGLAMENLGDIDAQSIAGTISTGTHGTGSAFGTISTQVIALRFVNGKGELVTCSSTQNVDLFRAAQVSLGALGIITQVTLQCVPSYMLLLQNRKESLRHVLATLDQRSSQNRNFEYYWMPYTNTAWTKSTNLIQDGEPDKATVLNYLSELLIENCSFKALCEFARLFPSQNKTVSKIAATGVPVLNKLNYSHRIYATMRIVRFTEMEYNVPADAYQDVMKEVIDVVNSEAYPIHFPIENRWVKGDDILMSPAYKRDSAYIACHVYHKKDNRQYFRALEEIFKAYGGRPHWGKMHTLTGRAVADRYPEFTTFERIRNEQDPDRMFTNSYLEQVLG